MFVAGTHCDLKIISSFGGRVLVINFISNTLLYAFQKIVHLSEGVEWWVVVKAIRVVWHPNPNPMFFRLL